MNQKERQGRRRRSKKARRDTQESPESVKAKHSDPFGSPSKLHMYFTRLLFQKKTIVRERNIVYSSKKEC
jgi:hypothetical protein